MTEKTLKHLISEDNYLAMISDFSITEIEPLTSATLLRNADIKLSICPVKDQITKTWLKNTKNDDDCRSIWRKMSRQKYN